MRSPSYYLTQLRELRLAAGLHQEELADLAGCTQANVSYLERGARKARMPVIRRLPGALNRETEDLIGEPGT